MYLVSLDRSSTRYVCDTRFI